MRIPLRSDDAWEKLNSKVRGVIVAHGLNLTEQMTVQVYQGVYHGLWETLQSLVETFPHKKLVALPDRYKLFFDPIVVHLSRMGVKCFWYSQAAIADVKAWVEQNNKDLLLSCLVQDDPISGEVIDNDWFEKEIRDKRSFRIRIFFESHRHRDPAPPEGYEVQVRSYRDPIAVVISGERARLQPAVAPKLIWPEIDSTELGAILSPVALNSQSASKQLIYQVEASLPNVLKPVFKPDSLRVFDRLAVFTNEIDGEALGQSLGKMSPMAGGESAIETTSPCRWQGGLNADPVFSSYEGRFLSEEEMRGLVLISSDNLSASTIAELNSAIDKIQKLQQA